MRKGYKDCGKETEKTSEFLKPAKAGRKCRKGVFGNAKDSVIMGRREALKKQRRGEILKKARKRKRRTILPLNRGEMDKRSAFGDEKWEKTKGGKKRSWRWRKKDIL